MKNLKIAIITVLDEEFLPMKKLILDIDERMRPDYIGRIPSFDGGYHEIILTRSRMGIVSASSTATRVIERFNIDFIIMVGIAGGVPNLESPERHVRLGDIVVSGEEGIIQFDFAKIESLLTFKISLKGTPLRPSSTLLKHVKDISTKAKQGEAPWKKYLDSVCKELKIKRPPIDILNSYEPEIKWSQFITKIHEMLEKNTNLKIESILKTFKFKKAQLVHPNQKTLGRKKEEPLLFIGPIASSNILLKDQMIRDYLKNKYEILAVEMESAGIMESAWESEIGYLTVRSIVDYCNWDKNDDWHIYAGVASAAFTRALIENIPALGFIKDTKLSRNQYIELKFKNEVEDFCIKIFGSISKIEIDPGSDFLSFFEFKIVKR